MPRARPGARKSTARRRIFRYRTKWTHHVIPERVKMLLFEPPHHMWHEWEGEDHSDSPGYVECEEPTMAELETKGVPEAEWPYYLGYMKRMLALYRNYTSETLMLEKTNLIEEYVLRGKDRDVLEQVQEVAAECAGIPPVPPLPPCPIGEQIADGGFEDLDWMSCLTQWTGPGRCNVVNNPKHGGSHSWMTQVDVKFITQTLATPTPTRCVTVFKIWVYNSVLGGNQDFRVIIGYDDASATNIDRTSAPYETWEEFDLLSALEVDKTITSITIQTLETPSTYMYFDDVTLYC